MFLLQAIGPLVPRWNLPVLPRKETAAYPTGAPAEYTRSASSSFITRELVARFNSEKPLKFGLCDAVLPVSFRCDHFQRNTR
jgi:hypothetical protein